MSELLVKTEYASSFTDSEYPDNVIVRHVYHLANDRKRYTAFYLCHNQGAADMLVAALEETTNG